MLVLTHNDLDALGCVIVLDRVFRNNISKVYYTNYGDMEAVCDKIILEKGSEKVLFIADVSFTSKPFVLEKLAQNFETVIHCDHHQTPDDFWDKLPNVKHLFTTDYCATKILYLKFEDKINSADSAELSSLVELINVYDVWKSEDEKFDLAQDLNDYFWYKTKANIPEFRSNILLLAREYEAVNYGKTTDYDAIMTLVNNRRLEELQKIKEHNLLHRFNTDKCDLSVLLTWDSFNHIMISEMRKGVDIVVGVSNGIFKVRVRRNSAVTHEMREEIRYRLSSNPNLGHDHAFTFKIENTTQEEIMNVIKIILEIVNG